MRIAEPASLWCVQEEKAQREQKKSDMARLVLAGQSSFTSDESDVFEGLSPHEIQAYVDEVCVCSAGAQGLESAAFIPTSTLCGAQTTGGAKAEDPFEGMSPEEINAFIEQNRHLTVQG